MQAKSIKTTSNPRRSLLWLTTCLSAGVSLLGATALAAAPPSASADGSGGGTSVSASAPVSSPVAAATPPQTITVGSPLQDKAAVPAPVANGVETVRNFHVDIVDGMTRLITASTPVASVFVADPTIATVRPISGHRLIIFATKEGTTSVTATDSQGTPIARFVVTVTPNQYVSQGLSHLMPPGARVSAGSGALTITGSVQTPIDALNAQQSAQAASGGRTVINKLTVSESQQVILKVRIAEMSRSVTHQLGINWQSIANVGSSGLLIGKAAAAPTSTAVVAAAGTAGNLIGAGSPGNYDYQFKNANLDGILSALDQDNLAHILAEPTLTALSGHSASFVSGGSFPVPIPGANGQTAIQFQNYGVQLQFKPVVLSSGEIFMHVAPTVSQISNLNSVSVGAGSSALVVPSLIQQSANTSVVLGSGQTLAIAGLLQKQTSQTDSGVPGVSHIPGIGAAFRADNFTQSEDELVILVTPYLVRPQSDPAAFELPGHLWSPPDQVQRFLLDRQTGGPPRVVVLPAGVGLQLK